MPSILSLKLISTRFGILNLAPTTSFPEWLAGVSLYFVARTDDEFSVMCPQDAIPAGIAYSADWRCLRVHSELAFDEVGVAARLSRPLAEAGLSIFVVSTHDRDYVFVAERDLTKALAIYEHIEFLMVSDI